MARKVTKASDSAAPKGAADVSELSTLYPDRDIVIAGRALHVREYRFVEGLKLRASAKGFFDALSGLVDAQGRIPGYQDIEAVFSEHGDDVVGLVAQAADVDRDWIHSLSDEDGDHLLLTWWLVNAGFFIRRVLRRVAVESQRKALAGLASSTVSLPPVTGAGPTTSSDSPNVS